MIARKIKFDRKVTAIFRSDSLLSIIFFPLKSWFSHLTVQSKDVKRSTQEPRDAQCMERIADNEAGALRPWELHVSNWQMLRIRLQQRRVESIWDIMRYHEISWDMTYETSWLKRIEHWLRIAACVKGRFNEHDCVSFCSLHKPACHGRLLANHLASHLFLKNLLEKNSYKKLRKQLFSCFGIDFYNSLVLGISKFFAQPLQNFPRSTPRWEEASGRRKESKKNKHFFIRLFQKKLQNQHSKFCLTEQKTLAKDLWFD